MKRRTVVNEDDFAVVIGELDAKFSRVVDEITLIAPLAFIIPELDKRIDLLPGFSSDGASIPRLLWWLIGHPFLHSYLLAAVLHDALYRSELFSRCLADRMLRKFALQLAREENRRCWLEARGWLRKAWAWRKGCWRMARCWVMWAGVRIGGRWVWMEHTPASVAEARKLVVKG